MIQPSQSSLNVQFEKDYVDYLHTQISAENAALFLDGVKLNMRPWEYSKAFYQSEITTDDKVLDTGAMHTFYCVYLSKFAKTVWATDSYSWADRDYASRLPAPAVWERVTVGAGKGKITAEHADLQNLQYDDKTFDKVMCISTIEHVLNDKKAMNEMFRILKPNGLLLLTTEYNHLHSQSYIKEDFMRIYNHQTLEELIEGYQCEILQTTVDATNIPPGKFTQVFAKLRRI